MMSFIIELLYRIKSLIAYFERRADKLNKDAKIQKFTLTSTLLEMEITNLIQTEKTICINKLIHYITIFISDGR